MPQRTSTQEPFAWSGALLISIGLLALAVRLPPLFHGLWYDEMFTLRGFVQKPWGEAIAGEYSPNNHVLFTILAKLITPVYRDPAMLREDVDLVSLLIRLPSLLAGALAPVALAWPMRRTHRRLALLLALFMALHPWLISSSAFARGYALLTLLAIVATHSLERSLIAADRPGWISLPYTLVLAATVYTHPLGVGMAVGHGAAALILRRNNFWAWFRSASAAGLLTIVLYAPFFTGVKHYWSRPEQPSVDYWNFVDDAIRHAHAGEAVGGLEYLLMPLLILLAGGAMAWRHEPLRVSLISFGVASAFGLLAPLVIPLAGEVRALHWLIPLYCIGAAAIFMNRPQSTWLKVGLRISLAMLVIILALRIYSIGLIPAQPIREAVWLPRPPEVVRIGLYMASNEAFMLYGGLDGFAYSFEELQQIEQQLLRQPIELVVFYEAFIQRDQPQVWGHIQAYYTLQRRLPGRIAPAAIYIRKPMLSNVPKQ